MVLCCCVVHRRTLAQAAAPTQAPAQHDTTTHKYNNNHNKQPTNRPNSYHAIFDKMDELGLEPNASLHHFVHPQWFEDLGAFEVEANIPVFVEWCVRAVELFGDRVHFWATFNEPTVGACAGGWGWGGGRARGSGMHRAALRCALSQRRRAARTRASTPPPK